MLWRQRSLSDYLVALLLAAAWMTVDWAIREYRTRRAQSWPTVEGRVEWTNTRVEGFERYQRTYHEVYYSYEVQGEYYSNAHQVDLESDFRHFPKGTSVLVHYKPSDPSVSFLDRTKLHTKRHRAE